MSPTNPSVVLVRSLERTLGELDRAGQDVAAAYVAMALSLVVPPIPSVGGGR